MQVRAQIQMSKLSEDNSSRLVPGTRIWRTSEKAPMEWWCKLWPWFFACFYRSIIFTPQKQMNYAKIISKIFSWIYLTKFVKSSVGFTSYKINCLLKIPFLNMICKVMKTTVLFYCRLLTSNLQVIWVVYFKSITLDTFEIFCFIFNFVRVFF